MDNKTRNKMLPQYERLIWWVIHRNRCLLNALLLEDEDVFQELAIAALLAIEGYDAKRSCSLFTHIVCKLQYEVLDIKRRYKPHGMTGLKNIQVTFTYLDNTGSGHDRHEIPVEAPFDEVELAELFSILSSDEEDAVCAKLAGNPVRRKVQRMALNSAQEKARDYFDAALFSIAGGV